MSLLGHGLPCHSSRYLSCEGEEAKLRPQPVSRSAIGSNHDGRLKVRTEGTVRPRSQHCVGWDGRIESITSHGIGPGHSCGGLSLNMDRLRSDI